MILILKNNEWFESVKIKKLSSHCCAGTDEWETNCNIEFIFNQERIQTVQLYGDTFEFIGVHMYCDDYDGTHLRYMFKVRPGGEAGGYVEELKVSNQIIECIYFLLSEEEKKGKDGWIKNFIFTEDAIFEDNLNIVCCEECNSCDNQLHECKKQNKLFNFNYAIVCKDYQAID